jgi:hypothetical protein
VLADSGSAEGPGNQTVVDLIHTFF